MCIRDRYNLILEHKDDEGAESFLPPEIKPGTTERSINITDILRDILEAGEPSAEPLSTEIDIPEQWNPNDVPTLFKSPSFVKSIFLHPPATATVTKAMEVEVDEKVDEDELVKDYPSELVKDYPSELLFTVSYTHLTLPTTPYV